MNRFLGDSPIRLVVKLVLVSLFVGWIMSVFGWTPMSIWYAIQDAALDLWYTGFDALGQFGRYIVVGAMVVLPAFLLLRLVSYRRTP